jgi:VWFA-related protein
VFKGDEFVDNLTLDDFEVYEDDILQSIDAVYLIKKTGIERKEERKAYAPKTGRYFYIYFDIAEYDTRIGKAVEHFVQNVLSPGDNLTVITPIRTLRMKKETLQILPKKELVRQLISRLKQDVWVGNSEYRNAIHELEKMGQIIAGKVGDPLAKDFNVTSEFPKEGPTLEEMLSYYLVLLEKLESMREISQKNLLDFAGILKGTEGQKNVFLFYQREFVPRVEQRIIDQAASMCQDIPEIYYKLEDAFNNSPRDLYIDVDRIKQAYADSSIAVHFLFFSKPAENLPYIQMVERSEDIFSAFSDMAKATGGLTTSSSNPEFLFQKAVDASENYYLIYYTPKNYRPDGKFRNIKVIVKGKSYRITHRTGYIAN